MKLKFLSIVIILLLVIAAIFIGFNYGLINHNQLSEETEESEKDDEIILGDEIYFMKAVNNFNFKLLKELCLNSGNLDNVFFSPYSIFVALAMTYEGSNGQTAEEIADVLSIEQDNESFHQYMQELYKYLNNNDEYEVSTANALWVRENYYLLQDYLELIKNYYKGNATEVDFSNPAHAADTINQWVEDKSNGLIKDLILSDYIDPVLTMLILTNAIYFKGIWEIQFDPVNTTNRTFKLINGNTLKVPTMKIIDTQDKFNYTETEDLQILELPYAGNEISMVILLPKNPTYLSEFINTIDNNKLSSWLESMTKMELDLYLPSFRFETKYTLNNYLQNLGMLKAFTNEANFSGISGNPDLLISKVVHKAFIEVNEEGTEAAAATAVIMEFKSINGGGSSRVIFNADHPFLFFIQHKKTGTILFMCKMVNPLS